MEGVSKERKLRRAGSSFRDKAGGRYWRPKAISLCASRGMDEQVRTRPQASPYPNKTTTAFTSTLKGFKSSVDSTHPKKAFGDGLILRDIEPNNKKVTLCNEKEEAQDKLSSTGQNNNRDNRGSMGEDEIIVGQCNDYKSSQEGSNEGDKGSSFVSRWIIVEGNRVAKDKKVNCS